MNKVTSRSISAISNTTRIVPRALSPNGVCAYLSVSRGHLDQLRKQPGFPAAFSLGGQRIAWRRDDIDAWIDGQEPASQENHRKGL